MNKERGIEKPHHAHSPSTKIAYVFLYDNSESIDGELGVE